MMKKSILFLFIALGFLNTALAQKKAKTVTTYKVQQKQVAETLKFLSSDALQGRDTGSKGIEMAAKFLEEVFVKNGVKPYFATYRDTLSNFDKPAYNIVGVIEGTDPKLKNEFVVIGAHYDHIGISKMPVAGDSISNGANDDASGTTAVTEIVNYYGKTKSNKRSILFCFFSAEEQGLLGSRHLAAKLKSQNFNIYTMLNIEMIGVPMKRDILAYVTGYGRSNMGDKFNEYAGKKLIGYLDVEMKYQLFRASDNYPFFTEFNVPAQTVCTFDFENFDQYHKVDDEFDRMDTAHMANFINEMLPVIEKMVNAPTKEITLKK